MRKLVEKRARVVVEEPDDVPHTVEKDGMRALHDASLGVEADEIVFGKRERGTRAGS